jgi:hypothetical protein
VLASTKGPHLKRILVGSVADRLMAAARCPVLVAGPMPPPKVLEPAVEPACPDCFESRRGSGGRQWWCTRHSQHHAKAHSYSFQRELALRTHDGAVTPTGID